MKTSIYVHNSGALVGTVKTARHKIYFRNPAGEWGKKFDHVQDGARGNINKDEAGALKNHVAALSSGSPNLPTKKGIDKASSVSSQQSFIPKKNNTAASPYFTGMATGSGPSNRIAKQNANQAMGTILGKSPANAPAAATAAVAVKNKRKHGS